MPIHHAAILGGVFDFDIFDASRYNVAVLEGRSGFAILLHFFPRKFSNPHISGPFKESKMPKSKKLCTESLAFWLWSSAASHFFGMDLGWIWNGFGMSLGWMWHGSGMDLGWIWDRLGRWHLSD